MNYTVGVLSSFSLLYILCDVKCITLLVDWSEYMRENTFSLCTGFSLCRTSAIKSFARAGVAVSAPGASPARTNEA
jgi:hypothetical protein